MMRLHLQAKLLSIHLNAEVSELIADVDRHWSEDERETFLKRLDASYEPFRHAPAEKKAKGKGKAKDTEAGG